MKRTIKKLGLLTALLLLSFFLLRVEPVFAAEPTVEFYPESGYAVLGKDFTVDIMLNTHGEDTTTTQVVFTFDPDKVRVTEAKHGDLYCQYPEDEFTVDNTNGVVKLTGFCLDPYYNSGDDSELFGRFTFKPLEEGDVSFVFEHNGSENEWKTVVKNNGSPPQNILDSKPSGGTYTVVSEIPSGSTTSGDVEPQSNLPVVGLFDKYGIFVGIGFVTLGILVIAADKYLRELSQKSRIKSSGTVIVKDE